MANDFLTVAIGGGANVASQAAFAASGDVTNGFANGEIPASAIFNKMVRQSSAIAAMIAQAIVDIVGVSMLDDGNSATQLSNFKQMLQRLTQLNYYTDTGAANAYVITPAPAIAAYAGGQTFSFVPSHANTTASTINVSGLGVKSIVHPDGSALESGDIPLSGLVQIIYQATLGKFILMTVSQPAPYGGTSIFRVPGTKFVLMWGNYSISVAAGGSPVSGLKIGNTSAGGITFPGTFGGAAQAIWAFPQTDINGAIAGANAVINSASTATLYANSSTTGSTATGFYFVIGTSS